MSLLCVCALICIPCSSENGFFLSADKEGNDIKLILVQVSIVMEQFIRLLHECGMPLTDMDFINSDGPVMNKLLLQVGFSFYTDLTYWVACNIVHHFLSVRSQRRKYVHCIQGVRKVIEKPSFKFHLVLQMCPMLVLIGQGIGNSVEQTRSLKFKTEFKDEMKWMYLTGYLSSWKYPN